MGGKCELLACYLANRGQLQHYAGRMTGDAAQAEDLVQEAWLRCDGAQPDNPLSYLYRVVRNLALDKRRRAVREERRFVRLEDGIREAIAADMPDLETELTARQELARVMESLADLPEITQQAIMLYRLDGLKLREIAKILDISITRVHGLVAEGMERCRPFSDSTE